MSTIRKSPLYKAIAELYVRPGMRTARPKLRSHGVFAIAVLALACRCSAQYHLETNYAEANAANDRQYLFGDWFGIRHRLADRGITFNIESTTDSMGVVHGGLSDQPAAFTRIRGTLDIDFDKLTGTSHELSFHATGLWQTGNNIGAQLGSYANPSGLASVHVFRVDSFWLQKQFADGIVTLRAGQMAGWDFFGNQEDGGSFTIEPLNYALGNIFSATNLTYTALEFPPPWSAWMAFVPASVPSGEFTRNQQCFPAIRILISKTRRDCIT
jgi:carbohydrate-selective porin OprB